MKFELEDQYGGKQEFVIKDGDKKGDVVITSYLKEDVSEIIDNNAQQRNTNRQTLGKGTQTSMYKLGQLSNTQAYLLMQDGTFFDDKKLKAWFNDLDNYLWRTVDKKRKGGANAV